MPVGLARRESDDSGVCALAPGTMFLCVSANPAIDKRVRVPDFRIAAVNRAKEAIPEPGGKAAHVALALRALGVGPRWIGFAGGATGDFLVRGLQSLGISACAVPVRAPTRENLAILDDAGRVTELLEPGGEVSAKELGAFRKACEMEFARGGSALTVVLSGSLPPGAPAGFYGELVSAAHEQGCQVILDTSGEGLRLGVAAGPDLVKPNREEAEAATGRSIENRPSATALARRMASLGAGSVALSLGKEGVLWLASREGAALRARAPEVKGRSAVGSGDAMVAGFAYALKKKLPPREALRLAVACGTANCLAESPGRIRRSDVRKMERRVRVNTDSQ
jgi:1-phosphofructokinase family hexose kinase